MSVSSADSTRQTRSASAASKRPSSVGACRQGLDVVCRTGLVYDERMLKTHHKWNPDHAERPERISLSYQRCADLGLVERCVRIEPQPVSEDEVRILHEDSLLVDLKTAQACGESELLRLCRKYSTHFDSNSYDCAMLSAGSCLSVCDAILDGCVSNGMAIVRPPGHHASADKANGYCYINNAALVAQRAITKWKLRRVAIIDWDVHHGQGTQRLFYSDNRVLYMSVHRYEFGDMWPNLRESDWDNLGEESGLGYNINVPLNSVGLGDSDYLTIFHQIFVPVLRQYNPELIIVSAGYDCAIGCPEGHMHVTPAGFAHMTHILKQFAGGRVCVLLEGGYCLKSLAEGVAMTLRELLGDPCPSLFAISENGTFLDQSLGVALWKPVHPSLVEVILQLKRTLRPFWTNCFEFQATCDENETLWKSIDAETMKRRKVTIFEDEEHQLSPWFPEENTGAVDSLLASHLDKTIDDLIRAAAIPRFPIAHRLCLIFSSGDALLRHKPFNDDTHPESPNRVTAIHEKLLAGRYLEYAEVIETRPVKREHLLLVHTPEHVSAVERLSSMSSEEAAGWGADQNSLYACPDTVMSAFHAVGGLIDAIDSVMTGKSATAFADIRPPGHHSGADCASGFCLFNNVAVAARYAMKTYGLARILIVDWDIHHGDGTQSIFYDDPRFLYVSLHRFDNANFYPGKREADFYFTGHSRGQGFNVNIPWSGAIMGNSEYIEAFQQIVMPIAYQFDPQLVLVSCGFDAALGDPLGGYRVTPEAYSAMTFYLTSLAGGRVILALEGGYNLRSISDSAEACCSALLGVPPPFYSTVDKKTIESKAVSAIRQVLDTQAKFWHAIAPFRRAIPFGSPSVSPFVSPAVNTSKLAPRSSGANNRSTARTPASAQATSAFARQTTATPSLPASAKPNLSGAEDLVASFQRVTLSTTSLVADVQQQFFAVEVLPTCPHVLRSNCCQRPDQIPAGFIIDELCCDVCSGAEELWYCLSCFRAGCGRHQAGHASEDFAEVPSHALAFGLADFSLWCYICDSYVDVAKCAPAIYEAANKQRFGSAP